MLLFTAYLLLLIPKHSISSSTMSHPLWPISFPDILQSILLSFLACWKRDFSGLDLTNEAWSLYFEFSPLLLSFQQGHNPNNKIFIFATIFLSTVLLLCFHFLLVLRILSHFSSCLCWSPFSWIVQYVLCCHSFFSNANSSVSFSQLFDLPHADIASFTAISNSTSHTHTRYQFVSSWTSHDRFHCYLCTQLRFDFSCSLIPVLAIPTINLRTPSLMTSCSTRTRTRLIRGLNGSSLFQFS